MRVLITGVTGFIGGHLVEYLHRSGHYDLYGISRNDDAITKHDHLTGRITQITSELSDQSRLHQVLTQIQPSWIFHLAGHANPRISSEADARQCWSDNFDATDSLFAAIKKCKLRPRILIASTGHIYGAPSQPGLICSEHTQPNPSGPYAESKLKAEQLCEEWTKTQGWPIIRVRLFNQIGPRQSRGFIVPDYASQIAEFECGIRTKITKGDLSAWRDLTDVRDIVVALELLMKSDAVPGRVFNAASGRMLQLESVFQHLQSLARKPLIIETQNRGPGSSNYSFQSIDNTAIRNATGWSPTIPVEQTLLDTLDDWRNRVSAIS